VSLSRECEAVIALADQFDREEGVMRASIERHVSRIVVAVAVCLTLAGFAPPAFAELFDGMVVFGDSLSDPGNHFVAYETTLQPPFAPLPDYPYAIGGHHFSNGRTWIEQLSHALGMPTSGKPALRAPGVFTNYAVGRARARTGAAAFPHFDLSTQVQTFLADTGGAARVDALYVIWIGANDLDDALIEAQTNPARAGEIIQAAVTTVAGNVYALWTAGARRFMILNLPDPALAPFVRALGPGVQAAATQVGAIYNAALTQALSQVSVLPGLQLIPFDVKAVFDEIVATEDGGRMNVMEPCLTFGVVRHATCAHPAHYLFWDGAHPTRAGHHLIAEAVLRALDPDGE
jgi:phospholipase/lecithinase/hemolysin